MGREPDRGRRRLLAASLAAALIGGGRARASSLVAGMVEIPRPGGAMPAYRAQPRLFDTVPILLLIADLGGIHARMKALCRFFAAKGYLAVAPDLYFRQGDPARLPSRAEAEAFAALAPDEQTMVDLDAALVWASRYYGGGGGDEKRVAAIGWGEGGRTAWLYGAHNRTLKCLVTLYGPLVGRATKVRPQAPLDVADMLRSPVLALYGGRDPATPPGAIDAIQTKLRSDGVEAKFMVYPEDGHGFDIEGTAGYDPFAASDSLSRSLAWLRAHGMW